MSDYEVIKSIVCKNGDFINPIEDKTLDYHTRQSWANDYETKYLLLNTVDDILIVFNEDGGFDYITTNY